MRRDEPEALMNDSGRAVGGHFARLRFPPPPTTLDGGVGPPPGEGVGLLPYEMLDRRFSPLSAPRDDDGARPGEGVHDETELDRPLPPRAAKEDVAELTDDVEDERERLEREPPGRP
jgi:hypothetical protein